MRNRIMIDKLKDQIARGYIDNDWVSSFVYALDAVLKENKTLTPKQQEKLEEIFEKY